MKTWFLTALTVLLVRPAWGDTSVLAPPMRGPIGSPPQTTTLLPFAIQQSGLFGGPVIPSMRYQQVYSASLFTNVDPTLIYVTTLVPDMSPDYHYSGTVPKMQINLSTTSNKVDGLSLVFQENVGTDDLVVFGPAAWNFEQPGPVRFSRPFRYDPTKGNLLMDVRIFEVWPPDPRYPLEALWANDSPTDEVSRVWATNVTATTADGADTVGVFTIFQFSPVPSLSMYWTGPPTSGVPGLNLVLERPTQPTVFNLQQSRALGRSALWRSVTNRPLFSNEISQMYYFPAASVRSHTLYYRLIWPSGH
jgi:hypothetical protein